MKSLSKRIAGGLVALVAAGGLAGPAHAAEKVEEYNVRFETVLTSIDNPCTPAFDDITLSASGHAVAKRWIHEDGSWRYQGNVRLDLSGRAADGTEYGGSSQFRAQTRVEDGVVSIVADDRHRLVSHGADPNFSLRLKVRVQFAVDGSFSDYEVLKDRSACQG
ncbi:MAG: hypothetical protein ACLGI2_10065 [Acidimicrobiia bacterium]